MATCALLQGIFSRTRGIRTLTWKFLRLLPLPVGLWSRKFMYQFLSQLTSFLIDFVHLL